MKHVTVPLSITEPQYAKPNNSTALGAKKSFDHGYAQSSSKKKSKKAEEVDSKQRKLSFAKVPSLHEVSYVSSDSDEPLSSIRSSEDAAASLTKTTGHSINGMEVEPSSGSPVKKISSHSPKKFVALQANPSKIEEKKIGLFPKQKKMPTLISSPGASKKSSPKKDFSPESAKCKDQKSEKKKFANGKKVTPVKKKSPMVKKGSTGSGKKPKKALVTLSSDSDSDLDLPLSKLKTLPKLSKKLKISKSMNSISATERSPKVKISHAKSPKMKDKVKSLMLLWKKFNFTYQYAYMCLVLNNFVVYMYLFQP